MRALKSFQTRSAMHRPDKNWAESDRKLRMLQRKLQKALVRLEAQVSGLKRVRRRRAKRPRPVDTVFRETDKRLKALARLVEKSSKRPGNRRPLKSQ